MAWHFLLPLLPVTAKVFHFLLLRGWVIVRLAVLLAMVTAVGLVAYRRPAREKASHRVDVPASFVARSWPGSGRFSSVADLSDSQTDPVTVDPVIAFDLSAAVVADLGLAVVVAAAAVAVVVVDSVLVHSVVAAFSFEAGQLSLEALDHLGTSLIP